MRTHLKAGRFTVLRLPIQHLYPIEVDCKQESTVRPPSELTLPDTSHPQIPPGAIAEMPRRQPRRVAAIEARDRVLGCVTD